MAQILVTKPGALSNADKETLRKAGVVCVEADSPASVKLIQPEGPALAADDICLAAMRALASDTSTYGSVARLLPKLLIELMEERRAESARLRRDDKDRFVKAAGDA